VLRAIKCREWWKLAWQVWRDELEDRLRAEVTQVTLAQVTQRHLGR
jgi:hypothetical protein